MDTYLRWNAVNWITVFLMVMIGYAVIGAASSMLRQSGSGD